MTDSARRRLLPQTSILSAVAIHRIALRVSDVSRSRGFYENLLGLTPISEGTDVIDLAFGKPRRTLRLRPLEAPGDGVHVDELAFAVEQSTDVISARLDEYGVKQRPGPGGSVLIDEEAVIPLTLEPAARDASALSGSGAAMFAATAVNHAAIQVPDYEVARDFLMDLLGLRLTFEDGKRCAVACGEPPDSIYINRIKESRAAFVDHFAFSVADFDLASAQERLDEAGLPTQPDGAYAWTTLDPDGFRVQICAEIGVYPGAATDPFHEP